MGSPLVSICVPNLNNRSFLRERFECIQKQTFPDFEVVVSDNFSEDGAWEFIREVAAGDSRFRVAQNPREGMYSNWNNCISMARGDWLYFATSDDTMSIDCVESLLVGQREHGCELVTSAPWIIDLDGKDRTRDLVDRFGRLLIGRRVGAGMLHPRKELLAGMLFGTPTLSMTQMLIRRSVFEMHGRFPTEFGSAGDYFWQMKVVGAVNSYYVPRKVGSWRQHPSQATSGNVQTGIEGRARMLRRLWRDGAIPRGRDMEIALGVALGWGGGTVESGMPDTCCRVARVFAGRARTWPSALLATLCVRFFG